MTDLAVRVSRKIFKEEFEVTPFTRLGVRNANVYMSRMEFTTDLVRGWIMEFYLRERLTAMNEECCLHIIMDPTSVDDEFLGALRVVVGVLGCRVEHEILVCASESVFSGTKRYAKRTDFIEYADVRIIGK